MTDNDYLKKIQREWDERNSESSDFFDELSDFEESQPSD